MNEALEYIVNRQASDLYSIGRRAWELVLAAVEAGEIAVDQTFRPRNRTLLHFAAWHASAAVMRRLLDLGALPSPRDVYGYVPMHLAVTSCYDALEKCKMLPVADLERRKDREEFCTPLYLIAELLLIWCLPPNQLNGEHRLEVLQWMLDQPECPILNRDNYGRTVADMFSRKSEYARPLAMVRAAEAAQRRWSPLRAVWTGAVAAAGSSGSSGSSSSVL
jgi:hypothetical protein